MKVLEYEKVIAVLERVKKQLPGENGILPNKFLSKRSMDHLIESFGKHAIETDPPVSDIFPEITMEKLAEEYLDICDHDCCGDQTVGIPACQFYEWPDVDGSGNHLPAGCKLKTILEGVQK